MDKMIICKSLVHIWVFLLRASSLHTLFWRERKRDRERERERERERGRSLFTGLSTWNSGTSPKTLFLRLWRSNYFLQRIPPRCSKKHLWMWMKFIILIHLKKGKIPSSPLAEPFGDDYSSDKNDSESTDLEYSEGDADTEAVQQPEEIEAPQPWWIWGGKWGSKQLFIHWAKKNCKSTLNQTFFHFWCTLKILANKVMRSFISTATCLETYCHMCMATSLWDIMI